MLHSSIVVTDASCFIILDKIDALDILNKLFTVVITTPEIAAEYGKRLPQWVSVKAVKNRDLLYTYAESIDIGEASAMALAMEIKADLLIIDDFSARKFASKLNLRITGTVGLFLEAKRMGVISEIKSHLYKIQQTNFRISHELVKSILIAANEGYS